jgi:hypothetical protein
MCSIFIENELENHFQYLTITIKNKLENNLLIFYFFSSLLK